MNLKTNLALSATSLLALTLAACDGHVAEAKAATPPEQAVRAATVPVAEKTIPRKLRLTGSLEANRDSDIAADASGRVAATYVERGAYVKKGTLLARLDARSSAMAAAQAKADAAAARAEATLRATELSRTDKLVAQKALADAELDRAKTAREAADQRVAAADARAQLQEKSVGDALIRAPFDGIVAERWVDEGEYVRPDTRVVTLVEVDTLRLKLTVPESSALAIKPGQRVGFDVGTEPRIHGEALVKFIGPQLRQSSRDLVVEAIVENTARSLKPGMFATAWLDSDDATVRTVPATAIKPEGGTKRVFVVTNGRLEERIVQIGERVGDDVVVVDGVQKDEKVVASVTPELRDGLRAD
jgi:membrane fusion protein (multidrug efflux system)